MATEPEETASPVCWLDQADDLYAGFATATEIGQQIRDWAACAPSPDIAARLMALLPQSASFQPSGDRASADQLRAQITAFLPRIRDNAMHAALHAIAEAV